MKQQYGRVEGDQDDNIDSEQFERNHESKDAGIYRLLSFPSIPSLRSETYNSHRSRTTSYASLIHSPTSNAQNIPHKVHKWGPFTVPTGWRFAVYGCILSCMVSFWINLLLTIVVVAKYGVDSSGRLTLFHGDCDRTKSLNTGIHVFINAMSTIILSSSNYVQQVLCAPTREEVDAAHEGRRRSRWADIGVPSMLNICLLDRRRVLLWYLLMFSSLPLHLFYNSAVFSSTATYAFPIVSVNEAFIDAAKANSDPHANAINAFDYALHNDTVDIPFTNRSGLPDIYTPTNGHYPRLVNGSDDYLRHRLGNGTFSELTTRECMDSYSQNFITSRGGLFLILDIPNNETNNTNVTSPAVFDRAASWTGSQFCEGDRFAWVCDQRGLNYCGQSVRSYDPQLPRYSPTDTRTCDSQYDALVQANVTNWRPMVNDYAVKSCLSEDVPQQCKLQASIHLMSVVLFLNLAKAIIMFLATRWMRGVPLLTLGDAIATFLDRPDPTTKNMCLVTRKEATHETVWLGKISERPRAYKDEKLRWHVGSGKLRQILIVLLLVIAIAVISFLFGWGLTFIREQGRSIDFGSLWEMGFGTVNPASIITFSDMPDSGAKGLVWAAFIANVPQLILSMIYFVYNGILTAYFLGVEWQQYMRGRKGLRVSDTPLGEQRSSYFLQLPYRAAIPLMIASGILHWLVSQSIFLVSIETFLWDDSLPWQLGANPYQKAKQNSFDDVNPNMLTCGFSPAPMVFVLVVAVIMVLSLVVLGARKYDASMPVASSNSLAIAAACHLPKEELERGDASLKKLKWGVVGDVDAESGVGHCCFSSQTVLNPKHARLYA